MSGGFGNDDGFFHGTDYGHAGSVPSQQNYFGQQDPSLSFGSYDYYAGQPQGGHVNSGPSPYIPSAVPYTGNIMTPSQSYVQPPKDEDDYENEPPLLEELGINFDHIYQKTLAVLNPLKEADHEVVSDSDMAGPLVFCMAFGATLLLAGKVQFGAIYGLGVVGCLGMYTLLNLMSLTGVSVTCVISVLGYCMLPMVILSAGAIIASLKGILGTVLTVLAIFWCSFSASKLFVSALQLDQQQLLIAYPCMLVYGIFALLTVF